MAYPRMNYQAPRMQAFGELDKFNKLEPSSPRIYHANARERVAPSIYVLACTRVRT